MGPNGSQVPRQRHDLRAVFDRIHELYEQISSLPRGYVSHKTIKGKVRHYRQWRDTDGKVKSAYIKDSDYEAIVASIERRRHLEEELAELEAYVQQGLRTKTPEVRTFLIRYDRKEANGFTIEPEEGSRTTIGRLPSTPPLSQSPSPFSEREVLRNVAGRLVAQGVLTLDQIAEATGLDTDEIRGLESQ